MIVRLPNHPALFDVLMLRDLFAEIRNRQTGEQFVVSLRDFRTFIEVTHPSITKVTE
jgi:hypothetical protein